MPKNKSHKGLLKRIRVTKTGKVKHKRSFAGHLRSAKSAKRLRRLRELTEMSNSEAKRMEKLLHRRLRGRNQPRSAQRRSPSPEQRQAAKAEAQSA